MVEFENQVFRSIGVKEREPLAGSREREQGLPRPDGQDFNVRFYRIRWSLAEIRARARVHHLKRAP